MKTSIIFIFAVHLLNAKAYQISDCEYINNKTDSVQINCGYRVGRFTYLGNEYDSSYGLGTYGPSSGCFYDLFKSDKNAENLLKVTKLRITDSSCTLIDTDLSKAFENVLEFDYSFTKSNILPMNFQFKNVQKFNASHNEIILISLWNFRSKPNLTEVDLSYNQILDVSGITFMQNEQLTIINMSHNEISDLGENIFYKLTKLKIADLSHNKIVSIHKNAFQSNINLEDLRLERNPLKVFDCHAFLQLKNVSTTSLSLNSIVEFSFSCPNSSLRIKTDNSIEAIVRRVSGGGIELNCNVKDFEYLKYFYAIGSQFENISHILDRLPSSLETVDISSINLKDVNTNIFQKFKSLEHLLMRDTSLTTLDPNVFSQQTELKGLDISYNNMETVNLKPIFQHLKSLQNLFISNCRIRNMADVLQSVTPTIRGFDLSFNFIGELNAMTFQPFTNLIYLNLSHTKISNFGFETFYHQTKLATLDISYNNLQKLDFSLFIRSFVDLRVLNLEGNNLTELNTITRYIFPNISSLGISRNEFPCYYLASFLNVWQHLHFNPNPSGNKTHMKGIDCDIKKTLIKTTTIANKLNVEASHVIVLHTESHITKYSLLFLCIICCGYLIVKSKAIPRIREKFIHNSLEDSSNHGTSTFTLMSN